GSLHDDRSPEDIVGLAAHRRGGWRELIIARSFDVIRRGTTIGALSLLLEAAPALALDPSLEVSQYGHAAWTARNGFSVGAIFAMAQTPDGYLWLGSEFGLFRFDGVQAVPWQPPA